MSISSPSSSTVQLRAIHNPQATTAFVSLRTSTNSLSTIEKANQSLLASKFSGQIVYEDKKTGEKSHSGIFSEEYKRGEKQTIFALLPKEVVDLILSFITVEQAKAAQVCKTFYLQLAPLYSFEAACKAGAKYHDVVISMLSCSLERLDPIQGIVFACQREDIKLASKLINKVPFKQDHPYLLDWAINFGFVDGLPILIKGDASESEKKRLQEQLTGCGDSLAAKIELLIEHPVIDLGAGEQFALRTAATLGYAEMVTLMLARAKIIDPTAPDHYPIWIASSNGHTGVVKALLEDKRVDPAVGNNFSLWAASEKGHVDVVKLLLGDPRVDPADGDNFPIMAASKNGHAKVVRILLADPRVDPTANNHFALLQACEKGHADVVKLLLKHSKVNPSTASDHPIRWASNNKHLEVVRVLLTDGRVNPRVALPIAKERGYREIVHLLEEAIEKNRGG